MSELKDPDDSFDFNLQPDGLDNDEYDELNDETFGDCVQNWDTEHDKLDECIMEMKRIVGDSIPEIDLRIAASKFNNNPELALKSILSNQPTLNRNNLDDELPKSIEQPVNGQLKNNLIEDDDDLIKNTLDRVSNHQFNQMHYQLIQQIQQQNEQISNQLPPSLFLNQQQQFNQQNLQSPHFIQFPQQFLPPHLQHQTPVQNLNQFISQPNNLINNSLTSSNTLSDSFASMNLNSNFNQNGVNDHNLITNDLTNNLNSTFQSKLINQQHQQKNNFSEYLLNQQHNLLNGNDSKPNKSRALTLEEIEQELLDGGSNNDSTKQQTNNKSLTLEDLETSLFSDLSTTSNHLNQFAQLNHLNQLTNQTNDQFSHNNFNQLMDQFNNQQFNNQQFNIQSFGNQQNQEENDSLANLNLDNLNEFPKLGEFVKLDKNASTSTELTTNNDRIQQPKYMKQQQNFRNHNFNQNRQNNKNFRNYPSLIPNPLNPIEMIRNDNIIKNNNGGNFNKYQNKQQYQQRNYQKNNYTHNLSYLNSRNPDDEYAGLMTPRDISWLRRIQQMQLEFDDPYVQDYYFVNYQTKKIAADVKKRDRLNGEIHSSVPQLVIPERGIHKLINNTINSDNNSTISSITTDQQSRYIPPDFSGSLGKIRVANVNYPRKLLDFENNSDVLTKNTDAIEPTGRKELNKFRRLLLDIERNLTMVLEIDHQNKKTAALPQDAQIPHLEERKRLCDELFNGILTTNDNKNVNFTIAKIRKGCMLIFKALQVLEPEQKTIIISDLLKVDNFHHVVMQKDKTIYCLDYGQVLIDAIKTIKNCDFDFLLKIADGLDDASIIAKFQCGQEIIEVLINQYHYFDTINNEQKIKWKSFLERIKEDIEDISHLNKLCDDNLALF